MLMVIAPLMCLEFVDPAVTLLAELTVKRLAGFPGGLCLHTSSEMGTRMIDRKMIVIAIVDIREDTQDVYNSELTKQQLLIQ